MIDGVLVVDKPAGFTSHDIVAIVRRITGAKKVGHLGTLDPAATGVLPLVINGATKLASSLSGGERVYEFVLKLGVKTSTDDDQGEVLSTSAVSSDALERLKASIPDFIGKIMQVPPIYSAIQVAGQRAYHAAYAGEKIELEPRAVEIKSISIINSCDDDIHMKLECMAGTYVRSLCRDLGERIGSCGHASRIRRLKSGKFDISQAVTLDDLKLDAGLWKRVLIAI